MSSSKPTLLYQASDVEAGVPELCGYAQEGEHLEGLLTVLLATCLIPAVVTVQAAIPHTRTSNGM